MRITGGMFRGRRIQTSRTGVYRPTQDKVRAAIFNHLGGFVRGAAVLDLYCGTGSLGMEALSRGASRVVFCDQSQSAIRSLRQTLQKFDVDETAYRIVRSDAVSLCSRLSGQGDRFDLIFVDPPYEAGLYNGILVALGSMPVAGDNAVVVVEHSKRIELPGEMGRLVRYLEKAYGDTRISYYSKRG